MPMVVHRKQRLHFRFEGERGAFLVLHHGLLGASRDWFDLGYVDALADQFRLIIPDARGHGRSDRPLDPADYGVQDFADDLIAVMDALDIRNSHFLGVSLGALVGFDLLRRYPDRLRVTLLGGEVPFVTPDAQGAWGALAALAQREPWEQIAQALQRGAEPVPGAPAPEDTAHIAATPASSSAPGSAGEANAVSSGADMAATMPARPTTSSPWPAAPAGESQGQAVESGTGVDSAGAEFPGAQDAGAEADRSQGMAQDDPGVPEAADAGEAEATADGGGDMEGVGSDEAEGMDFSDAGLADEGDAPEEDGASQPDGDSETDGAPRDYPATADHGQAAPAAGPATALATLHEEDPRAAGMALLEAMAGWPLFTDERTAVDSPLVFFDGARDPAHDRLNSAVARVARARLITYPDTTTVELVRDREAVLELLFRYIRTGRRGDDPRPEQGAQGDQGNQNAQGGQGGQGQQGGQGGQQDGNARSRNRSRNRGRRGRDGGGNRGGQTNAAGSQGGGGRQRDNAGRGGADGGNGNASSRDGGNNDSRNGGAARGSGEGPPAGQEQD